MSPSRAATPLRRRKGDIRVVRQAASVKQAVSEAGALGSTASLEKKQSMLVLQRQMRKAVTFAAALKAKLDHGASVLKKAIVQSKQVRRDARVYNYVSIVRPAPALLGTCVCV
eukprot:8854401-Pyramimonas_sp.AAC.1